MPPLSNAPEIKLNGYEIPNTIVWKEHGELVRQIRNEIESAMSPILISIDGAPGSGKSYKVDVLREGLMELDLSVVEHGMDRHLKTIPGTPERARLHKSDEDFRELYCDDTGAAAFLNQLLTAEDGDIVQQNQVYSRSSRGVVEGRPIYIPHGEKRVVIFEGTGATSISKLTDGNRIPIFNYTDLQGALDAKLKRDEQRGIQERTTFHIQDIVMATRLRCMPIMSDEDLIYFDNTMNLKLALEQYNIRRGRMVGQVVDQ
jgi:uridine kinase